MRLTSLLIVGLSLTALADVVNAGDRFDSDVRRVDVIEQIDHQAVQMDSSKDAGHRVQQNDDQHPHGASLSEDSLVLAASHFLFLSMS